MYLQLDNSDRYDIVLESNPATVAVLQIFKHLQHVPVPFRKWDNPFYLSTQTHETLVSALDEFAGKLDIEVDVNRCLNYDQDYLNYLHKLYEKNYNGDPRWLDYHEHIHFCEPQEIRHEYKKLAINYREKAGPLERKFDMSFRYSFQTSVEAGQVYLAWAELGKTPYHYWQNQEPNNVDRICELAKPWLILRPKLMIALTDIDFLVDKDINGFNLWWNNYHDTWCRHWNIQQWSINDMFSVSSLGRISDLTGLIDNLVNGHNPAWIKL